MKSTNVNNLSVDRHPDAGRDPAKLQLGTVCRLGRVPAFAGMTAECRQALSPTITRGL